MHLELFEISKIDLLRLVHLFTSLLGAVFLILIWSNPKPGDQKSEQDWGLLLIAFALLLWAGMDAYRVAGFMVAGQVSVIIKTFSAYNNAFFIASLPFFQFGFDKIKKRFPIFENSTTWALAVMLLNVLVVMFYTLSWGQSQDNSHIIKTFDVVYSVLTFMGLGYAITKSFQHLKKFRASFVWASILVTVLLIVPQLAFLPFVTVTHYDAISLTLFVSHIALIMLLLVLAQSWIVEKEIQQQEAKNQAILEGLEHAEKLIGILNQGLEDKSILIQTLTDRILETESMLAINQTNDQIATQIKELSEREMMVLRLINKSYNEIADELYIARETVISHKKNIESKLGISGKENLVEYAIKIGVIEGK